MIVESLSGVTLAGGAPFGRALFERARALAPVLVAADGGADRLLRLGASPEAVFGDFDSITASARTLLAGRLFPIAEQETTDFDKALRSIAAPFVLGLGFAGSRADHGLAVLNALTRHAARRCLILSGREVTFLCPPYLRLDLPVGTRISLFPMGPVAGESRGLRWPISGLAFAPDGAIGTSNMTAAPVVELTFDAPRMLVILPLRCLEAALRAVLAAPLAPEPRLPPPAARAR